MKLENYVNEKFILPELSARTKEEVLAELVRPLAKELKADEQTLYETLLTREKLGTTGIGDGVAIPHGKVDIFEDLHLVVGRSTEGVEFAALDHKPVHVFFLALAPEKSAGKHLKVLAFISRLLLDGEFKRGFFAASGKQELCDFLKTY
ncbi:MAG: PTS sugar transporter subunit IIA [Thermodesulfobacteriota bacterium]